MTVCGFSFGKDLSTLDYPVEASVRSVLPLCDRFVFVVGRSSDDTRDRVAAIDPKIEIVDSEWADLKVDGKAIGAEANKALDAAQATGCTWGFYSQPDEIVHEDDLPLIRAAMDAWADKHEVKALLFRFLQFVLDYQTVDPWMFHKASRVVSPRRTRPLGTPSQGRQGRAHLSLRLGQDPSAARREIPAGGEVLVGHAGRAGEKEAHGPQVRKIRRPLPHSQELPRFPSGGHATARRRTSALLDQAQSLAQPPLLRRDPQTRLSRLNDSRSFLPRRLTHYLFSSSFDCMSAT